MNLGSGQDWEPVVVRKRAPSNSQLKDEAAVNAARRAGLQVDTVRKQTPGAATTSGKSAAKIDAETEDFHRKCLLRTIGPR